MRRGALKGATVLWAVLSMLMSPTVVVAADNAPCSEWLQSSKHAGIYVGGNKQGVRANLEGQTLNMCVSTGGAYDYIRASLAFVNIQGSGSSTSDIVQIGVGKCQDTQFQVSQCDNAMNHNWAWGRGSCGLLKFPTIVKLGSWTGATQDYYVTHTGGYWKGYIAGELRASVAEGELCWSAQAATWFSETWDSGDALGGSGGNHYAFTTMRMQNSQNGSWVSPSLNTGNECNLWSSPHGT